MGQGLKGKVISLKLKQLEKTDELEKELRAKSLTIFSHISTTLRFDLSVQTVCQLNRLKNCFLD